MVDGSSQVMKTWLQGCMGGNNIDTVDKYTVHNQIYSTRVV